MNGRSRDVVLRYRGFSVQVSSRHERDSYCIGSACDGNEVDARLLNLGVEMCIRYPRNECLLKDEQKRMLMLKPILSVLEPFAGKPEMMVFFQKLRVRRRRS